MKVTFFLLFALMQLSGGTASIQQLKERLEKDVGEVGTFLLMMSLVDMRHD